MKKDWLIYAVITGGVLAVVYFVKKTVAPSGGIGGGAVGNNGVVQTVAAAGTQQVLDQAGNAVVGVFQGIGDAAYDLDANIDPDTPVQATGTYDQQKAADDYVLSTGGQVTQGLPE